jgi:hypothetical protein
MSQSGINNRAGGGGGGSPVQTLTGNDSVAVPPSANNINVLGNFVLTNNVNGIQTSGNAGTSTLTVQLTNRFQASNTISDANPHVIYTQSLGATPAAYLFKFDLVILNTTSSLMAAYSVEEPIRTDGTNGHIFHGEDVYLAEEGAMSGMRITFGLQGLNSFFVTIKGYDTSILDYNLTGTYQVIT